MQVIPVIDLKDGLVVRGVAGVRHRYRPIESRLADSATPSAVAAGLRDAFAFESVYVADLDAIAGAPPDWRSFEQIAESGMRIWLDAGLARRAQLDPLIAFDARRPVLERLIVGLETVRDVKELPGLVEAMGADRAVFSLDLRAGAPLAAAADWRATAPLEIVRQVAGAGFRRLIVLDLAAVGVGRGPSTAALCREIKKHFPGLELISGGGVRDRRDLATCAGCGCQAVLVASALHDGRLSRRDLSV